MIYRFDLKIAPELLAYMRNMVRMAVKQLRLEPNQLPPLPEEDPDLEQFWQQDLADTLSGDLKQLEAIFEEGGLGEAPLDLEEPKVESVIRACSAARIKVRETALASISDEVLESSDLDLINKPLEVQQAYSFYLFISEIQSIFIYKLDPETFPALPAPEEEDE